MRGEIITILEIGNCKLAIEPMNYRLEIKEKKNIRVIFPSSLGSALKHIYEEMLKQNIRVAKKNNEYKDTLKDLIQIIQQTNKQFDEIIDQKIYKEVDELIKKLE